MKKGVKISLGILTVGFGVLALSSCTKSFCSNRDTGNMMYAFDVGVTSYVMGGTETYHASIDRDGVNLTYDITNVTTKYATWDDSINDGKGGFKLERQKTSVIDDVETFELTYLNTINNSAKNAGIRPVTVSTLAYFRDIDDHLLFDIMKQALVEAPSDSSGYTYDLSKPEDFAKFNRDIAKYSYLKYVENDESAIWDRWSKQYDLPARDALPEDVCPSTDFIKLYKSSINNLVGQYRTCLTTRSDEYGTYGYSTDGVYIRAKDWGYGWSRGPLEGLLVYPIGSLVDVIALGFKDSGVQAGWAALLAIFFVTVIVRGLMMLLTFRQTMANAKMTELQPEIQKIQNKYPNANTNNTEKQRMAEEMNRLYKKNKINPLGSLLIMFIQFPVFICVWGALSGNAALASGTVLGLNLSLGIRDVLFNGANWTAAGNFGAVTALILFLLMSGAQVVSMLLPQWMQKARAKKAARLGVNPSQNEQTNRMKMFTYIMLAMIIFMGFSLVSAMGVYWFVGALFSIGQTLITQAIISKKMKKK